MSRTRLPLRNEDWPEGGLPHGEHPRDYGYGSESGDTARTPADAAETQPSEAVPGAVSNAGKGASSPSRSLADIRATGAAWIQESEIARICDAINEAETLTSRAHDALYADPFDRQVASDAIWKIHDVLRGLRDGR